jgi:hypothetical protein
LLKKISELPFYDEQQGNGCVPRQNDLASDSPTCCAGRTSADPEKNQHSEHQITASREVHSSLTISKNSQPTDPVAVNHFLYTVPESIAVHW